MTVNDQTTVFKLTFHPEFKEENSYNIKVVKVAALKYRAYLQTTCVGPRKALISIVYLTQWKWCDRFISHT